MTNEKAPERIWLIENNDPEATTETEILWSSAPSDAENDLNVEYVRADLVAAVRADEREAALLQATKDVCMYCDGRALGYEEAVGPNSAGNYTHEAKNKARLVTSGTNGIVLCKSSTIHARMNFEKAHSGILSRES